MTKQKKIIFISILLLVFISVITYFLYKDVRRGNTKNEQIITNDGCLENDEIVDYDASVNDKIHRWAKSPVIIYVKDKNNNEKYNFQIDNISESEYGFWLFRCNVYVSRVFNFDSNKGIPLPNYKTELWRYNFIGEGKYLLSLFKKEGAADNYSSGFQIDSFEHYIVLERSYSGSPSYALVIKDLETLKDDFVLSLKGVVDIYTDLVSGNFGFNAWTEDGKYFWGSLFDGADTLAFIRIEAGTWKWEVFPAPAGTMGGDAFNPERGLVTYRVGAPWTADADFDQMYREQWKKEGKKVPFYVYNLITKEKTLLAEVDDPTWYFKPKWISDTELEYYLPGDLKQVYQIKS